MFKRFLGSIILSSVILNAFDIQTDGVEVKYKTSNDEEKTITIKREKPTECKSVEFKPEIVYAGVGQADTSVNENCKRSFVTYMGKISPIKFSSKVETYGELEVMEFILRGCKDA